MYEIDVVEMEFTEENNLTEPLGIYSTYDLEYRERELPEIYEQPPVIMMPSKEQDYQDNYFNSIFPKAVRLLHESKVLV